MEDVDLRFRSTRGSVFNLMRLLLVFPMSSCEGERDRFLRLLPMNLALT